MAKIIHLNLLALRALRDKFEGRIRCVYLNPPYNNKEEYTHYNDEPNGISKLVGWRGGGGFDFCRFL
jgi:hypothetical protein